MKETNKNGINSNCDSWYEQVFIKMSLPKSKQALKEDFYSWLNKNQRACKQDISDAIDALYRIKQSSKVSVDDVISLQKGLELPYLISYPIAEHCCHLAISHPEIEECLIQVSQHSKASIRRNMITVCLHDKPKRLMNKILKNGLNDRSKSVRLKSIDVICRMNKASLKHKIQDRCLVEKNADVKKELENAFSLLDQGYAIDSDANLILVQLKNGGTTGIYLSSVDVNNKQELEKAIQDTRNSAPN